MSKVIIMSSDKMQRMVDKVRDYLSRIQQKKVSFMDIKHKVFFNQEIKPYFEKSVSGAMIYLFLNLLEPDLHTALFAAQLEIDAISRSGAKEIILVVPYIPYLRQDRRDNLYAPISAKIVLDNLQRDKKVSKIITVDMHSAQLEMVLNVPLVHLSSNDVFAKYFQDMFAGCLDDLVVCAPDYGSTFRSMELAKKIGIDNLIFVNKKRTDKETYILDVSLENVREKSVIIYDDMADSGGTVLNIANLLKKRGAKEVIVAVTHAVLGGNKSQEIISKFRNNNVSLVVSDSIDIEGVNSVSLSEDIAKAIDEDINSKRCIFSNKERK